MREEKIKHEAEIYAWTANQFDIQQAFSKGAEWADTHPNSDTIKKIVWFALCQTNILIADSIDAVDWEALIKKAIEEGYEK